MKPGKIFKVERVQRKGVERREKRKGTRRRRRRKIVKETRKRKRKGKRGRNPCH